MASASHPAVQRKTDMSCCLISCKLTITLILIFKGIAYVTIKSIKEFKFSIVRALALYDKHTIIIIEHGEVIEIYFQLIY